MFLFNYSNLVDPLLSDIRNFVTDFAGIKAEDRVLDICCGTGAQVIKYGMNGIEALGIDNDPNMINAASKNKRKSQLTNVSFCMANAAYLPFSDDYFDYSSIMFGVHDKEKSIRYRIIAEMKRVVKHTVDSYLLISKFRYRGISGVFSQER